MIFDPTPLPGSFLVRTEPRGDARGIFARTFCEREFAAQGLETKFVQANISRSAKAGTLRGMHYQLPPSAEIKLVRCAAGALFDVIVDLRSDSPTYLKWFGQELTPQNMIQMYVPRGFAHGFISLAPDTEIQYMVSAHYAPDCERGLRFNDPRVAIQWPSVPVEISVKDAAWRDYDPDWHGNFRMQDVA